MEVDLSGSTEKDVVNTVGGAGRVSTSGPPDLARSGIRVSRFRAKGVAAVEPCGGDPSAAGSLVTGGTSVVGENPWSRADREGCRDQLNLDVIRQ